MITCKMKIDGKTKLKKRLGAFTWGQAQQDAFEKAGGNSSVQYHLSADASKTYTRARKLALFAPDFKHCNAISTMMVAIEPIYGLLPAVSLLY